MTEVDRQQMDERQLADEVQRLGDEARTAVLGATTLEELESARVAHTGRKSKLTMLLRGVASLTPEGKRRVGAAGNEVRSSLEALLSARKDELERAAEDQLLATDRLDLTMPGRRPLRGVAHPIQDTMRRLEDVFVGMGYEVAEGPEAETDWHNFQALNMPADHPARTLMDTYYLTGPRGAQSALLRTHTSPVQIRVMESRKPPIYIVCPGRVFRRDAGDATHSPVFHQIEALAVDEGLTFADLKGTIQSFVAGAYGPDVRSRLIPSFYPFTEPSAELQVTCPVCRGDGCNQCTSGWHGVGGAGMVDPNVFEAVGIDPERYTGFAFGMGIEKIPMERHGITDLRPFLDGDQRFLEQFRGKPVR